MAMSRLHKPLQHVNTRGCWVDKYRLKGNSPLGWCTIQASNASAMESVKLAGRWDHSPVVPCLML